MSFTLQIRLLGPFQTQRSDRLTEAKAPYDIVSQVHGFAATALPELIERVSADPIWAVRGAARIWLFGTMSEQAVRKAVPSCELVSATASAYLHSPAV
jgi:hypothetical protein